MHPDEQTFHPDATEKPDHGPGNGLQCFLNMDRACGPDCMAYCNPPMVKGPEYDGKQWSNCMVLTGLYQGSKHIVAIASLIKSKAGPGVPTVR